MSEECDYQFDSSGGPYRGTDSFFNNINSNEKTLEEEYNEYLCGWKNLDWDDYSPDNILIRAPKKSCTPQEIHGYHVRGNLAHGTKTIRAKIPSGWSWGKTQVWKAEISCDNGTLKINDEWLADEHIFFFH